MNINFETISFTVAVASIIIAIVSLVFSILFYRWAEKSNRQTFELSKGIEGNTKKIEDLFDKFYSDTFGLMKSNYEAMQSNIFGTTISSGDSTFSEKEQLEYIIISLVMKPKVLAIENLHHSIEMMYPRKFSIGDINEAIESLKKKDGLNVNQNLISISTTRKSESDEDEG